MDLLGMAAFRKDFDLRLLRFLVPFGLTGIVIGALLFRVLDARVVAGIVEDVTADGVWVNVGVAPLEGVALKRPVLIDADGATLTPALSGGVISNLGASAAAVFALPPAVAGLDYTFVVEVAQELRIDPNGTETIALPSSGVQGAAGKYLTADAIGEKVRLVCISAGTWDVEHYSGTWTAES